MAIKGSLREAGMADVCQLLSIGQKTGRLSVTDGSRFGQVYFDQGRITYATIVNRRDRLGDLLVRSGALTHEQLLQAVDAQAAQPERRLGEILLRQGTIDTATLTEAIESQIEEAIYYLFTWNRGHFYFEPGKAPETGEILIRVNSESLLLEGARRVDEWSVIEKKIHSMDSVFDMDRARMEHAQVALTPQQERLIGLLDGQRTVQDLAEASGLGEFETGKALYGLVQAGFAERSGRKAPSEEPATPDAEEARNLGVAFYETSMLDDAHREFQRALQGDPHDVTARHYMGLIALRRGEPADAVRKLSALVEDAGPRIGVLLNLALALRLQRRYDYTLRALAEARKTAPNDPRIRLAEGATHLCAGDLTAATERLEEYRRTIDSGSTPPAHYFYCASLAAVAAGRLEEAEERLEAGLAAHPASAPLHLLAGTLAEQRADTVAAERAYQRAAEEDPRLAQAHRNLGDIAVRRGADREAMEHYRRAAEIDPRLGDELFMRLADLHYRHDNRSEAIHCWRRALELNPENEVARNHLDLVTRAAG